MSTLIIVPSSTINRDLFTKWSTSTSAVVPKSTSLTASEMNWNSVLRFAVEFFVFSLELERGDAFNQPVLSCKTNFYQDVTLRHTWCKSESPSAVTTMLFSTLVSLTLPVTVCKKTPIKSHAKQRLIAAADSVLYHSRR